MLLAPGMAPMTTRRPGKRQRPEPIGGSDLTGAEVAERCSIESAR